MKDIHKDVWARTLAAAARIVRPVTGFAMRKLTASEKSLIPEAMAAALDLDEVVIINRFHSPIAAALGQTVVRGARIFWANGPDEARSLAERAHLAHELVHVWQYRHLGVTGVELLASRVYRYRLEPNLPFATYGYEQQAAIVEDAVRIAAGAAPRWAKAPGAALAYQRVILTAAACRRKGGPRSRNVGHYTDHA